MSKAFNRKYSLNSRSEERVSVSKGHVLWPGGGGAAGGGVSGHNMLRCRCDCTAAAAAAAAAAAVSRFKIRISVHK